MLARPVALAGAGKTCGWCSGCAAPLWRAQAQQVWTAALARPDSSMHAQEPQQLVESPYLIHPINERTARLYQVRLICLGHTCACQLT